MAEPLFIDFNKRLRESKWRMAIYLAIGLIVLGDGIYQIVTNLGPFHITIGIALVVAGPLYLLLVWLSPKSKCYFKVDGDCIEYKLQFGKVRRYGWDTIKKVDFTSSSVTLAMSDGATNKIGLGTFAGKDRKPIRETITDFAREKSLMAEEEAGSAAD